MNARRRRANVMFHSLQMLALMESRYHTIEVCNNALATTASLGVTLMMGRLMKLIEECSEDTSCRDTLVIL